MSSFIEKLKQKVDELEESTKKNFTISFVDDEVQQKRYEICKSCEHFFPPTGNCKKCGCFMKLKTKLENVTCPVKKW